MGWTLAELIMFQQGLARYNDYTEFRRWEDKQVDKALEAPIEKGSQMDKVWKAGEWIDENHAAMQSGDAYLAFMASQRGFRPTVTVKNSKGRR
jgi:hypothetical protein